MFFGPKLSGSIPALVTPFAADGSFDEPAYRDFHRMADRRRVDRAGAVRHHR